MLRNIKDRGGEARGGTAGGWRDEMMADYGRMVEAMLSERLSQEAQDRECAACQACLDARERGGPTGLGWAGGDDRACVRPAGPVGSPRGIFDRRQVTIRLIDE